MGVLPIINECFATVPQEAQAGMFVTPVCHFSILLFVPCETHNLTIIYPIFPSAYMFMPHNRIRLSLIP
jgi:hypothetical protein